MLTMRMALRSRGYAYILSAIDSYQSRLSAKVELAVWLLLRFGRIFSA